MPAVDDAVRQFNEAAANMPTWMFAPGGFWGQQQARINFERGQARQDANDWINQQMGQRMPGGMPRSPEGRRLDLSADPRYGAQFPQAPPAPQINQQFVDQANAAAPGFIHVGKHSGLQPLLPETWETGPVDGLTPAAAAALRERQLRQRLASDPQYQEWKAAAQAAGADAMAKGLPGPQLKGPTFVGDAFRSEADQARFKAAADAFANRRADRRQRVLDQMERNRAAAAIRNLRDPQTRNAVLAAGLFGGQMPENAAIALQLMGHPDAARLFSQSRIAAQESADRRYGVDRGVEAEQWKTYNRDRSEWDKTIGGIMQDEKVDRGTAMRIATETYGLTPPVRPSGQPPRGMPQDEPQLPQRPQPNSDEQPISAERQGELVRKVRSYGKIEEVLNDWDSISELPPEMLTRELLNKFGKKKLENYLKYGGGAPDNEASRQLRAILGIPYAPPPQPKLDPSQRQGNFYVPPTQSNPLGVDLGPRA